MTHNPLRVMIVAGEASGDLLGARLMNALHLRTMGEVVFSGVGGDAMQAQGLTSLFPMTDLSVMGLAEILPRARLLRRRIHETAQAARRFAPDALVLIDSPGFNRRLAALLRDVPFPVIQYVAPSVWAWRAGRAKKLARVMDAVMTLLPFEPPYFTAEGMQAFFVGHSILETGMDRGDGPLFRRQQAIPTDAPFLMILPGSRAGEVARHLTIFGQSASRLAQTIPQLRIGIFTLPHLRASIEDQTRGWTVPPLIMTDPRLKPNAFAAADAALAASGTVALELAMARCPAVIAYRVHPLTAAIARRLIKSPFVSLPNILSGRALQPEMIQDACEAEALASALLPLMTDETARRAQLDGLDAALAQLRPEGDPPSLQAADAVMKMIAAGRRLR